MRFEWLSTFEQKDGAALTKWLAGALTKYGCLKIETGTTVYGQSVYHIFALTDKAIEQQS